MKNNEPRSLQDILSNDSGSVFTRLARQQSDNDTLLSRIRALLPSQFVQHLVAVTYREGNLVLVADSPAWANRIRFENAQLYEQLISSGAFLATDAESGDNNGKQLLKIVVRSAASEI